MFGTGRIGPPVKSILGVMPDEVNLTSLGTTAEVGPVSSGQSAARMK
jgi:hypothetical protein